MGSSLTEKTPEQRCGDERFESFPAHLALMMKWYHTQSNDLRSLGSIPGERTA